MRVLSAATRSPHGVEAAWVVDARDLDPVLLAPVLDGLVADAWNATFDALVTDVAIFGPAGVRRDGGLRWWDGQLADALLHAGFSGFGWFHGLAWATERYLGVEAEGKGTTQLSYDAHSDLSDEQVRYAAADAVETLWVGDALRHQVDRHGLAVVAELEMAARPFLDHLQRAGLPFDATGYAAHLEERRRSRTAGLTRLAELTGGGQANLFSPDVEPVWNPASEPQAKLALNRWSSAEVEARFTRRDGRPRLLGEGDPLDAATLAEIGGPLAEALLTFRADAKLLSAYGDNLLPLVGPDGRFHPQYVQVVGVNTGRLSSRNPNAQTFPPEMKHYLRPERAGRVFVHADVGQAELRWLAQVSGDEALRRAFAAGVDVHVATAERMFGVDMAALAEADPPRWDRVAGPGQDHQLRDRLRAGRRRPRPEPDARRFDHDHRRGAAAAGRLPGGLPGGGGLAGGAGRDGRDDGGPSRRCRLGPDAAPLSTTTRRCGRTAGRSGTSTVAGPAAAR